LLDARFEAVFHRIVQRIVGIEVADALQVQVIGPLLDRARIEVLIVGGWHGRLAVVGFDILDSACQSVNWTSAFDRGSTNLDDLLHGCVHAGIIIYVHVDIHFCRGVREISREEGQWRKHSGVVLVRLVATMYRGARAKAHSAFNHVAD
jgi:hypothetical protein